MWSSLLGTSETLGHSAAPNAGNSNSGNGSTSSAASSEAMTSTTASANSTTSSENTSTSTPKTSSQSASGATTPADKADSGQGSASKKTNSTGRAPLMDYMQQMRHLEAASHVLPQPTDTDRSKPYTPRYPVNVPVSYPTQPLNMLDNSLLYERLDTDSLFFAFYYRNVSCT